MRGFQGGVHTFLSLEASQLAPGPSSLSEGFRDETLPITTWELKGPDGLVSVAQERWTLAEPHGDHWFTGPHLVVMQYFEEASEESFDRAEREAALEDFEIQLTLSVRDHCGREASARRLVRLKFEEEP